MKITKAGLAVAFILIFSVSALAQSDSKTEKIIDELLRKSGEITTYKQGRHKDGNADDGPNHDHRGRDGL